MAASEGAAAVLALIAEVRGLESSLELRRSSSSFVAALLPADGIHRLKSDAKAEASFTAAVAPAEGGAEGGADARRRALEERLLTVEAVSSRF